MAYLSKSDYKVAHNCPTKLYYKKNKFPSTNDNDEYLKFLAKGGYAIGKLATLYYPDGIEILSGIPENALKETDEYLKRENVTLFEAAVLSGNKLIRIDILEKKGNHLNLIEVKSKSYDSNSKKGIKDTSFKDYLFDVAFQYLTVRERFPEYKVIPYLLMPDKSKYTEIEGLSFYFKIKEIETGTPFRKYEVTVDEKAVSEIIKEQLLAQVNVENIISEFLPQINKDLELLLPSLENGITRIETQINKDCFKCEYSVTKDEFPQSGYDICWKDMPNPKFHIKNITRVGNTLAVKEIDTLISQKLVSFDDISDLLDGSKKSDQRRKIQIDYTKKNKIFLDPELKRVLNSLRYPLHFIDFETTSVAIPYHKGMRPYEQLAFQWSCHTIEKPGAEPIHSEWLNLEKEYPNFKFAESLMSKIGDNGTPFMWSHHENTTLKSIYRQIKKLDYNNLELEEWLERMIKFGARSKEEDLIRDSLCEKEGKFIDLHDLAKNYFFHPFMQGKTSIKKVLPAVLQSVYSPRIEKWLKEFEKDLSLFAVDKNGYIEDPYKHLPPLEIYEEAEKLVSDDEESHTVNEGTGAMTAYQDIMIGLNAGKIETIKSYEKALKRYCKLDTLAMVIIWEYWINFKN